MVGFLTVSNNDFAGAVACFVVDCSRSGFGAGNALCRVKRRAFHLQEKNWLGRVCA